MHASIRTRCDFAFTSEVIAAHIRAIFVRKFARCAPCAIPFQEIAARGLGFGRACACACAAAAAAAAAALALFGGHFGGVGRGLCRGDVGARVGRVLLYLRGSVGEPREVGDALFERDSRDGEQVLGHFLAVEAEDEEREEERVGGRLDLRCARREEELHAAASGVGDEGVAPVREVAVGLVRLQLRVEDVVRRHELVLQRGIGVGRGREQLPEV